VPEENLQVLVVLHRLPELRLCLLVLRVNRCLVILDLVIVDAFSCYAWTPTPSLLRLDLRILRVYLFLGDVRLNMVNI
jgi:hypothetical protein